jgi:hypothetical protein
MWWGSLCSGWGASSGRSGLKKKKVSPNDGVLDARYIAILSQMHRVLGKKVTSNLILDRVGKSYFGSKVASRVSGGAWLGVFSQDVKPAQLLRRAKANAIGYGIINTDPKSKPGEHWVGIIYDGKGKKVYIYDSFGRKSSTLLPKFMRTLKKMKVRSQDSKHDAEQKGAKSADCGARVMSWLLFAKRHGVTQAMKI